MRKLILEVLAKSFGNGWQNFITRLKGFSIWLVGSAGSFFSTQKNLISSDLLPWWPLFEDWYVNIVFVLFLIIIITFSFYQIKHFFIESWRKWVLVKRESIYGRAIVLLAEGYSQIHANQGKNIDDKETKEILTSFCDNIKEIFDYKTKSTSSVSIKVITDFKNENQVVNLQSIVTNLVRNTKAEDRDSANYNAIEHTIAKNTCYQYIITNYFSGNKNHKLHFLSNDLPSLEEYENSSFEQYQSFVTNHKEGSKSRRNNWPLEYRSELVVPISPSDSENLKELAILGFLCIDCCLERKEVFNEEYDIPMIKGVADGLYGFIKEKLY